VVDPQTALRANKEVFFFRLVPAFFDPLIVIGIDELARNERSRKSMSSTCRRKRRFADRIHARKPRPNALQFTLRLKTLLAKKRVIQSRTSTTSKLSATFVTLLEGFQQFDSDLNKLQVSAAG
jgi:hypothetical protein